MSTALTDILRLEDPGFYLDDPYPALQRLRQEDPVFYYEPLDMWVISKYEDIRYVGRTPEIFSSHAGIFLNDFRYGDVMKRFFGPESENLSMIGPPRHNELRNLVNGAFTPRILFEMRESIREMCRNLLAAIKPGEVFNWSHEVAEPLPLMVIAILMGVPIKEYDTLKFFSDEILKIGMDLSAEEVAETVARLEPMAPFFEKFLAESDENHASDVLAILQRARKGREITTETVHMLLSGILSAGNETTRNTLNGAMILLSQHPDQMKRLAAEPSLAKTTTEECLRYVSPVRGFGRTVVQDVVVRDRKIRAGQHVLNFFMSGNRDEEIFQDPDVFDLSRQSDKANLAFGFGQHFCPGAGLARMEITILLEEVAARFSGVELVGSPIRDNQLMFNAWEDVNVRFVSKADGTL
jgi:cytochrome P450